MYSGFNQDVDGMLEEEKMGRQSALGYNRAAGEGPRRGPTSEEAMAELASLKTPQVQQVDFSGFLNSLKEQRAGDQQKLEGELSQNEEMQRKTRLIDAAIQGIGSTADLFGARAGRFAAPTRQVGSVSQAAEEKRKRLLEAAILRRKGIDQSGDDQLKALQYQQGAYNADALNQQRSIDDRRQALMAIAAQRRAEEKAPIDAAYKQAMIDQMGGRLSNDKERLALQRARLAQMGERSNELTPYQQVQVDKTLDDRVANLSKAIPNEYLEAAQAVKDAADLFGADGQGDIPGVTGMQSAIGATLRQYAPSAIGGFSTEEKKNRALIQNLLNLDLKKLSGAAVSNQEQQRFEEAKGLLGSRDPAVVRQGIRAMMKSAQAIMRQREAGFSPEVKELFRARGGMTSEDMQPKQSNAKTRMIAPDGKMYEVQNVDAALKKGWKVAP